MVNVFILQTFLNKILVYNSKQCIPNQSDPNLDKLWSSMKLELAFGIKGVIITIYLRFEYRIYFILLSTNQIKNIITELELEQTLNTLFQNLCAYPLHSVLPHALLFSFLVLCFTCYTVAIINLDCQHDKFYNHHNLSVCHQRTF